MRLRTDIPIMDEQDLEGWIQNILKNMHVTDIDTIKTRLEEALALEKVEMIKNRRYKMCDKCSLTYPYHIVECHNCGSQKLREFKQVWNPNPSISTQT